LLLTVKEPVRLPNDVGVNTTLIVQCAFIARLVPQLLVCEKSPVICIPEILTAVAPVFVSVRVFDPLFVFTTCGL
jgi:hypothetical protein